MRNVGIVSDEGLDLMDVVSDEADKVSEHYCDLWAMAYGFRDLSHMKEECGRMEQERLAELSTKALRHD